MDIRKIRSMQSFMGELTILNISKGEALQQLLRKGFDYETFNITKAAIDKYFRGIEEYRIYERSFFLKEISKEDAEEYFNNGKEVYSLNDDGSENIIENYEDLANSETYGIEIKYEPVNS